MNYIETPVKSSEGLGKRLLMKDFDKLETGTMIWMIVRRHKFALVTIYAVVISLFYFIPFLPDLLFRIIGR